MSRIGNRVLSIPENVTVTTDGNIVTVKGPKGELSTEINKNIAVEVKDNELVVTRKSDAFKAYHGTANANIANMIKGVTEGFEKKLEIVGVGYRFNLSGNKLTIQAVPSNTELTIKGADKQLVGEFAANVRKVRKPEPYKGKGIRYQDEYIIRKVGKKAA